MKTRIAILIAVLALGAGSLWLIQSQEKTSRPRDMSKSTSAPIPSHSENAHSHSARVPAYQSVSEVKKLGPTLPAAEFFGKAREAYEVAKKIPQTLAQLPCYCECDRGFGHKSLHTCFEDDHASHCAVCVDEALLAYRLQQEEKLTPEQVRERIIAQYSSPQSAH